MRRVLLLLVALIPFCALAFQGASKAVSDDKLVKSEKAYKALKEFYKKHPKDAKAKKEYVTSTVLYAKLSMYSTSLDRKVKYVQALTLYREALKVDSGNKEAKESAEMIESIYKQMGRPVPKGGG